MSNMRVMTMAHIRNARGLKPEEKAILYTVESRGEVYSTRDTLLEDCGGMSKSRFYRHRNSLVAKGLLQAEVRRPRGTTVYRVNSEAVEALAPRREDGRNVLDAETLGRADSNVLTADTILDGDTNVSQTRTSTSSSRGHQRPQTEDTKKTLKGTPQGVPRRGPVRIGGECYLRLVRPEEMNAWERVEYNAQMEAMTEDQRAYWLARYEDEAHLP
jgi:hypothetical protein